MRNPRIAQVLACLLLISGCTGGGDRETGRAADPPASARPATPYAGTGAPTAVLVGAGDIASCDSDGDSRTARLLDAVDGTVMALGDNAYTDGTPSQFTRCYEPSWGRHRLRTRPVLGNHEYHTAGAAGYFRYFGAAAGPAGRGWYSFEAGAWHVVVLNTNCDVVACSTGSAQRRWLRQDLAASAARGRRCTVALGHHPLFTSGRAHGPAVATRPLVATLYDAGVELLISGHNHQYERFAPQHPTGRRDAQGVRQFVVGTGGNGHYPFGPPTPHSEVRHTGTYGVLRLDLHPDRYHWRFIPEAGGDFTDSGTGRCH
jgi:acid phosphatase type 7